MKVSCRESLAIHRNRVAPGKARLAVQHSDASLLQSAFDAAGHRVGEHALGGDHVRPVDGRLCFEPLAVEAAGPFDSFGYCDQHFFRVATPPCACRSEEHTSELQSLMRISYAVFCLKKQTTEQQYQH